MVEYYKVPLIVMLCPLVSFSVNGNERVKFILVIFLGGKYPILALIIRWSSDNSELLLNNHDQGEGDKGQIN